MKFDLSNRRTQIVLGGSLFLLLIVIVLVYMMWPKRSKYTISGNLNDGAFNTDVIQCQATFNASAQDTVATNAYNTCLQTAMSNLINRKCPYIAGNAITDSTAPNYQNYQYYQADLNTISNKYNILIQAAPDGTISTAGPPAISSTSFSVPQYSASQGMTVAPVTTSPYGNGPEMNFLVTPSNTNTFPIQVGQTIANFTVSGLTGGNTVTVVYVDPSVTSSTLPVTITLKWPSNTPQWTIAAGVTATTIVTGGPYTFAAGSLASVPTPVPTTGITATGVVTTTAAHNLQAGQHAVTISGKTYAVQSVPTPTTFTINTSTAVATAGTYTVDVLTKQILRAARKADITGATRKYLAASCPGFYQAGTSGYVDPTTAYLAWTTSATTTTPYGFIVNNVTPQNVLTWAKYAAAYATDGITTTGPLLPNSGSTLYNASQFDSILGTNQTNYQYTQNYGPGTVLNPTTGSGLQTLPTTIYGTNGWQ